MPYVMQHGRRHFSDTGGDGEPLILLHGLGSRGSDWQPQIDALSADYRIITLDFPGHGDSDSITAPVSIADFAADVVALLDHLAIDSAHIVGLSLGGMAAFQLAVAHPQRLRSLVIINAAPGPGKYRPWFRLQARLRLVIVRAFGLQTLARRIAPKLFPMQEQASLRQQFIASVAASDKQSYLHTLRAIAGFDLGHAIDNCAIPALILAAEHDYTPVDFKWEFVQRMGNARLRVVPGSRHASPLDSADFCNREIRAFLQQTSLQQTSLQRTSESASIQQKHKSRVDHRLDPAGNRMGGKHYETR